MGKTVTASGLTLTGLDAGNYALATTTATTTATITALTVTPSVTVANKTYDGTTSATLTSCTVAGLVGGDVVGCTGSAGVRHGERGRGQDGDGERADADGRRGGELRAGDHDGDDDGDDHGRDGDADGDRGEQSCMTGRSARRSRAAR